MLCKSALDALVNLLRVVMAGQNMVVNTIESHDSNVQNNDSNSRLEEDIQHYKDEGSRCFNIQNFFYGDLDLMMLDGGKTTIPRISKEWDDTTKRNKLSVILTILELTFQSQRAAFNGGTGTAQRKKKEGWGKDELWV
ncbi:hypothetical protein PV325_006433 [Microctonus aethiopoides]|nr:hypothetical protein PV325_006433 [Microctonus aethiopoides]